MIEVLVVGKCLSLEGVLYLSFSPMSVLRLTRVVEERKGNFTFFTYKTGLGDETKKF